MAQLSGEGQRRRMARRFNQALARREADRANFDAPNDVREWSADQLSRDELPGGANVLRPAQARLPAVVQVAPLKDAIRSSSILACPTRCAGAA